MKRRPTVADRQLADVFRKLADGQHLVTVVENSARLTFDHLPVLKTEGTTIISIEGRTIYIAPWSLRTAA